MVFCVSLASCNLLGHTHTYPNAYETDETYHWRICKTCNKATDKVGHAFGEWEKGTASTNGQRYRQCAICQYIEYEKPAECNHDFSAGWKKDSVNHYKQCSICQEKQQEAPHEFDEWIVDVEPTETTAGHRYAECSVCDFVKHEDLDPLDESHSHFYPEVYYKLDNLQHYKQCSCGLKVYSDHTMPNNWTVDKQPTQTEQGHKYRDCTASCGYREEDTIAKLHATGSVDFYAINDFHGKHDHLAQIAAYMRWQLDRGNTVALNSGDMFQGSMESNSNYGRLFSQCMDIAGFDAFTFGNHEFDWGLDNLKTLAQNSATPFLGANIYNWNANTRTWGDFAEDLAKEYVIKDMDNGLRVGIIGIIGADQITSISSQLVQTIGFKNPKDIVPNLSNKLKNELGCDLVVVSAHTGQETFINDYSWDITQYADAVFCAHTHQAEINYVNGVPFIQGGSYGNNVSHVKLSVDYNGNVVCNIYENIGYYSLSGVDNNIRDLVQTTIDNSNARIAEEATEVLAELKGGSLDYQVGVARLVSHAIATYATEKGYNIELAMVNKARSALAAGDVNYTNLYSAIPFDNVVYIARVSGRDLLKEAGYDDQSIWRVSGNAIENSDSKYYTIAVIDYLLFHQNTNREYNYFPSFERSGFTPIALEKSGYDMYNYRFITRDFLRAKGSISATTYTGDNIYTNKSKLEQSVQLGGGGTSTPTEPTHAGTLDDPYTVADAIALASGYTSKNGAPNGFIKGTVSDVSRAALSDRSGDVYNVYITDGNGNSLNLYYVKKFQGATLGNNWDSPYELSIGDEVLLYAEALYMYNNNPQVYNGYVVTINGVAT